MKLISSLFILDPKWRTPIAIALGAIPGALCRYYLTGLCRDWFGTTFPYGTFLINISGAFVMGFFATYVTTNHSIISPELRLWLAVGFLGSYTTFSTYALDTSMLIHEGALRSGFLYWMGSAALGWIALEGGSAIARRSPF
jgi:fluoride exporter